MTVQENHDPGHQQETMAPSAKNGNGVVLVRKHGGWAALLLLAAVICWILFVQRGLDDNRFTSWKWVLGPIEPLALGGGFLAALALAALLSCISISEKLHIPIIFLSFFLLSMLFWKEPEVILDASRYFTYSKIVKLYGSGYLIEQWGRGVPCWTDLPAIPLLFGMAYRCFGEHRIVIQCLNSSLFAGTAVLTCLLGRLLWTPQIGTRSGILLAGVPYLFTQAPLMLIDVPLMFFMTLSTYLLIQAVQKGGVALIAASSLSIAAALLSKFSAWTVLAAWAVPVSVWAAVHRRPGRFAAVFLTSALVLGTVVLLKADVILSQLSLLREYQWAGLSRWHESLLSTALFQIHPFITISACYAAFRALKKRDGSAALILVMALAALGIGANRIRYILPVFPLITLLAAYGMEDLTSPNLRKLAAMTAVTPSVLLSVFLYLPFVERISLVNLDEAGRYLDRLDVEQVDVFTLPAKQDIFDPAVCVPLLDISTHKKLCYDEDISRCPPGSDVHKSSLRFTWEYRAPSFYRCPHLDEPVKKAIVIVSDGAPLPEPVINRLRGYLLARAFEKESGVFALRTLVYVYLQEPWAEEGQE